MFASPEDWLNLTTSLLGGSFAGAAVVGLLFKFLIKNQLEKSLKQFQHDLDAQKEKLQTDLTIYADRTKQKISNHQQKSITALEAVYGGFIRTALPRQKFSISSPRPYQKNLSEDEINSAYFQLFSSNFQAFDRAFQSVTDGFACLEDNAIYLDHETEFQVATALRSVNSCYQKWLTELHREHDLAQTIFRNGKLNQQSRTMNFNGFFASLLEDWNIVTGPVKSALKLKAREILTPNE